MHTNTLLKRLALLTYFPLSYQKHAHEHRGKIVGDKIIGIYALQRGTIVHIVYRFEALCMLLFIVANIVSQLFLDKCNCYMSGQYNHFEMN